MAEEKVFSDEEKDRIRRMKWWHEAKFGMFIHFGVYSVIGRGEWVMNTEAIPVAEYEQLAPRFNPKPHAARDWAKLAKRAGMKYMVMTTKHHDGFCLFDTKFTNYCAPKQACGRDLVAEYIEAARAEGLRFGFYYSLMDWHHPDGARCAEDESARKRFVDYTHGLVRELMTNYGKVDILWYDYPWPLSPEGWESVKMNRMVREIQPDIIINDRSRLPEDFRTPEQQVQSAPAGHAWETCMTMNGSWGYHKGDDDWKTPKQILRYLITCAQLGGNYLLNIGPKADGSVPEESVRILNVIGKWMDKYGETIYGTDKGNTLYIHVSSWPGEELTIGGLQTKVESARLLPSGEPVAFKQNEFGVHFTGLPAKAPDELASVLKLEHASVPTQRDMTLVWKNMPRGQV